LNLILSDKIVKQCHCSIKI